MSKEEKMMILQMVAEGKITPEQGAELLRAVGEGKPEAPAAPKAAGPAQLPQAPSAPGVPATVIGETIRKSIDSSIRENLEKNIERAARQAERAAERAASHAEEWADKVAKHAEEIAGKAAREGENLGKVLGESGENLGKIIGRIFSGSFSGFSGGPQFEFHEEVRGELPAEGEVQVSLSTLNGRITVDTWDESGFRLDVRKTANAVSEEEAKELVKDRFEFTQDGLNLTARARELPQAFGRSCSVGFTLTLPRDRKASLALDSSNGRLAADGVSGSRLRANTANGRVSIESCSFNDTEIDTANGRIEFEGRPGNFRATTANGRIDARLQGTGNWKMDSANGRLEAAVKKEPGAAYEVEASTVMGRIEVTGMEGAEILVDETRQKFGSRRYKARSRGYSDAASKVSLVASTAMGKVTISL